MREVRCAPDAHPPTRDGPLRLGALPGASLSMHAIWLRVGRQSPPALTVEVARQPLTRRTPLQVRPAPGSGHDERSRTGGVLAVSLYPAGKRLHEFAREFACCIAVELPARIEECGGTADVGLGLLHARHVKEYE